ncbi:O-antigen polymerase [Chryseobacterium sp. Mn2064]|uniref:O-antigen polymerase n=1 Tax=Chryseobacterium sp. Mn2064 TaxID=3395263 RepID=UPI003BE3BCA1
MTFIIILYIIFILGVFFFAKKNYRILGYEKYDALLPINIMLFFSALTVPYMFYIINDPGIIYTPINPLDVNDLLLKFIILQVLSIISFMIGMRSFWSKILGNITANLDHIQIKSGKNLILMLSIVFYALFLYNIKSLNLQSIFEIFINRNEIVSKLGYIYYVQQIIGYYVIYLYLIKDRLNLVQKISLGAFFAAFLMSSLLSGGRTQIVYLLVFCFIVLQAKKQFTIKQVLKPKYLVSAGILFLVIIVIPKFRGGAVWRNEGVVDIITSQDDDSYKSYQLVSDISGLDRYLFIIDMFDKNVLWYGKSYEDIFKILLHPIVRGSIDKLPKGDDGLYLAVMSYEKRFIYEPSYRIDDDYKTSYPPGNYAAYMNFGEIGLLITYFLIGGIANVLYKGCAKGRFKYIYFYTLFISGSIAFSNMIILNFVINIITLFIVFVLVRIFSPGNVKLQKI